MFKNKRILVTECTNPDRKLYEDVLQFLIKENSTVITLVSKKNVKEFIEKYPRVISIVLDVKRCEAGEITAEKVLLEKLPFCHHVINFSGDTFINFFLEVHKTIRSKIQYEVMQVEVGSIRSKIKHKDLLPSGKLDPYTIVQIIPDISLGQTIRESFGKIGKSAKQNGNDMTKVSDEVEVQSSEPLTDEEFNPNIHISRYSVFRRSLSIRIRKSYPVRQILQESIITSSKDFELEQLFIKENEKIKTTINKLYAKSSEKEKRDFKKLHNYYDRMENKLNKEVKRVKFENVIEAELKIEPLNEGTRSRTQVLGEETANKIIESRKKLAVRRGIKDATRLHNIEARALEQELALGLKDLAEESYVKLLCKEAKELKKITKKYMAKRKAIEKLYD